MDALFEPIRPDQLYQARPRKLLAHDVQAHESQIVVVGAGRNRAKAPVRQVEELHDIQVRDNPIAAKIASKAALDITLHDRSIQPQSLLVAETRSVF